MTRTELIIQLLKIAIGLAFGRPNAVNAAGGKGDVSDLKGFNGAIQQRGLSDHSRMGASFPTADGVAADIGPVGQFLPGKTGKHPRGM